MSNLVQRLLTAIVAIPILLVAIIKGGVVFTAVVTFIAAVGMVEFYNIIEAKGQPAMRRSGVIVGSAMLVIAYFFGGYALTVLLTIGIIGFSLNNLTKRDVTITINNIAATMYGVVYVGWLLSHVILMRNFEKEYAAVGLIDQVKPLFSGGEEIGIFLVVLMLACTFLTDTGAYFAGRAFGKRKLAPVISPKKSWEGAIGGVATSMVAAVIVNIIFASNIPIWYMVLVGFFTAIAGIVGDLVESALKRDGGVKDSGVLFPGHGGVLDRLDSILFTTPTIYYLMKIYVYLELSGHLG